MDTAEIRPGGQEVLQGLQRGWEQALMPQCHRQRVERLGVFGFDAHNGAHGTRSPRGVATCQQLLGFMDSLPGFLH